MKAEKNDTEMLVSKAEPKLEDKLLKTNKKLLKLTADPEKFLIAQPEKCKDIAMMLQKIYRATVESDKDNEGNAEILTELLVEEMDEEQIWQQLELRNNIVFNGMITKTAKLLALREQKLEVHLKEEEEDADELPSEDGEEQVQDDDDGYDENIQEDSDDEDNQEENEDEKLFQEKPKCKQKRKRKSVVDDKFFKLDEMEAFLEAEEAKEERKQKGKMTEKDDDGIDYFADDLGNEGNNDSDDDDFNPKYKDFFDMDDSNSEEDIKQKKGSGNRKQKYHFADNKEEESKGDEESNNSVEEQLAKNKKNGNKDFKQDSDDEKLSGSRSKFSSASENESEDSSSDDDHEKDDLPKSSFELRQARLEQRIRDYEEEVLGEKPWQLKGEVQATSRPQNSLLEEILEFDSATRPAPIITEETNRCLEDIIKQRIRDKAWDDVVRIAKPIHTPQEYRKQLVLDQEKSKESLAHIYEKEYQHELEKLNPNRDSNEPEEPKEHQEIRREMRELFIKLDALTNFHFTPKPVAPESKIITNTPAVAMEEVAPVAVSDANLLAPEEVFRGPKHELIGKSERTKTDKNRALRKKKSKQRAIRNALEAKDLERQKMGIPLTKKEESAKLMNKLTKQRNVEKTTLSTDQAALKSSKAFFSKLQDQVTASVKATKHKKQQDSKSLSAKKLKL